MTNPERAGESLSSSPFEVRGSSLGGPEGRGLTPSLSRSPVPSNPPTSAAAQSQSRRVLAGISGGIAAYKVCEVISTLHQSGVDVRGILTSAAREFITPLTVATLSRHPAYTDEAFWQADRARPLHIELGEWAEVFVIAPLTVNTLAKLAGGFADNLLASTVLASNCPVLLVPAANTEMWQQTSVQRNWETLQADRRYHWLEPGSGRLACDRVGKGRMAEPAEIIWAIESLLYSRGQRDLVGKQILVSAGGTREYLDPVRFLGNPSTGKMGVAIARAAWHRGASVTLVYVPSPSAEIAPAAGLEVVPVESAAEMGQALQARFGAADWTIMAAAVADVRPAQRYGEKIPKRSLPHSLDLAPVPDLIAELAATRQPHQRAIGFAAQTGEIVEAAREKMTRKHLDAIVANPVDLPDAGFGSDTNQAVFLARDGRQMAIAPGSKFQLAHRLLDWIHTL